MTQRGPSLKFVGYTSLRQTQLAIDDYGQSESTKSCLTYPQISRFSQLFQLIYDFLSYPITTAEINIILMWEITMFQASSSFNSYIYITYYGKIFIDLFFVIGKSREIHHVFMAYGWIMLNQPRRYWASGGLRHLGGSRSTCQGRGWNWSCYSWMFLFPLGFIVYPLFFYKLGLIFLWIIYKLVYDWDYISSKWYVSN